MEPPAEQGAEAPQAGPQPVTIPVWNAEEVARRPDALVFVAAGMQAALAAQHYFPQYVVVCGPLAADWRVLKGRQVLIWPEGGEQGDETARKLAETLHFMATKITYYGQSGAEPGWGLQHALDEDWSKEQVLAWVTRDGNAFVEMLKGKKVATKKPPKPPIEGKTTEAMQADIHLQRDHLQRPYPTEANALEILSKHERFKGRIWLDLFSQRLMIDDKRFERDSAGVDAMIWMQQKLDMHNLPLTAIGRAASYLGAQNAHHYLKDYLDGLEWDGTDRHSGFMANVYGTERNEYTEAIGRNWLIAAVARIYDPGCKADNMLVLEGGQGVFKSTSLRILGGEWFNESHEDPIYNRKDFLGQLQGYWIIEIPEMHSIAGAVNGIEKIKGIISCQTDDYRRPWGTTNMPYPRQCLFAGTTNLRQWNSDPTGGRRFWPVVCGKIDLEYLKANRDQLWAEAVSRYKAHEHWWEVPGEVTREQQDLRRRGDVWEPVIEKYVTHIPTYHEDKSCSWSPRVRPLEYLQVHRILLEAINKQVSQWNRSDEMRVASILGTLGYERQRSTVDGARAYIYRRVWIDVEPPAKPAPGADDDSDVPY